MRIVVTVVTATALCVASAGYAATTYTYDTLGRLSTVSYDNGKQIVYNYDPGGNRSSVVTQVTPMHAPAKAPAHKSARKKAKPKH